MGIPNILLYCVCRVYRTPYRYLAVLCENNAKKKNGNQIFDFIYRSRFFFRCVYNMDTANYIIVVEI